MAENGNVLRSAVMALFAIFVIDCSDSTYPSPRMLDRLCRIDGACLTAGACERTSAISNDSIGFRCGVGWGRVVLDLQNARAERTIVELLIRTREGEITILCDDVPCGSARPAAEPAWVTVRTSATLTLDSVSGFDLIDMR